MQTDFAKGLLNPDLPAPEGVIGPNGHPAGKRYDVYRNNVVVSLTEALAAAFPVIKSIVGEDFFTAMAGVHVRQHPPKSPLMIFYGEDFPAFLSRFPPVTHLGYLPDMARLEHARRAAYHAADATPCPPEKLAGLEGPKLFGARLVLHPSIRIVSSRSPIFSIWRYNSTRDKSPLPDGGETVLISRPANELKMQIISKSTAVFLNALTQDALGVAMEKAATAEPEFDLAANLTELLSAGLLVDIQ